MLTADDLLRRFHDQIRVSGREDEPRPGLVADADGPVRRRYPQVPGELYAMVESPDGLGDDPDRWIARQRDFFAARGERVEWKTYSYDEPADLGGRLVAHGFAPEPDEALMLGETAVLRGRGPGPEGVVVREADLDGPDAQRIGDLHALVWGEERRTHGEGLALEKRARPETLDVLVAEVEGATAADPVLCAAWVRYSAGTDFCSMWGGTTHPDARRRGLYRALLECRAARAQARGYALVRVDASPDSEPILTRLGLVRAATTTPYVLTLPG